MFNANTKFKNHLFAMIPTVDKTALGIALAVLEETKKNVKGLKLSVIGNANFEISVKNFQELLDQKKIDLVDNIPDEVVKELYSQYLTNKKNQL